jgi:sarcosine oxidase subunit beta
MPSKKKVVCRCVDVTEYEIKKAIEEGRRDVESLKRVKGVGTGPCQGKSCMSHIIGMLARANKKSPGEIGTMKSRQPVQSIDLSLLAAGEKDKKKSKEAQR